MTELKDKIEALTADRRILRNEFKICWRESYEIIGEDETAGKVYYTRCFGWTNLLINRL